MKPKLIGSVNCGSDCIICVSVVSPFTSVLSVLFVSCRYICFVSKVINLLYKLYKL